MKFNPTSMLLPLLLALATGEPILAAPPTAAVTDVAQVDDDFALQGEYLGRVTIAGGQLEYAGLQVVALGDGKFEANYLKGGLPAAGWDRRTKMPFKGDANEHKLTFANEQTIIHVEPALAVIQNSQGGELGRLDKIRRISRTLDAVPPSGAKVLLSSADEHFEKPALTPEGWLNVGVTTRQPVEDFRLHLEFRTPYMPRAKGQGRGNSGIYIQQRYEVQILDSFGLPEGIDDCGSLYKQRAPAVNACLPPLTWQTYDIYFTAARWDANKKKIAKARITVLLNGEPVHENVELTDKTGSGKPEGPEPLPINLQNHGNPVHFRNLWILAGAGAGHPPAAAIPVQTLPGTCHHPPAW